MASIDYQEARKEITKMFRTKDSSGRKVIFWYDPPMNFKEDILSDSFDCCRVLVCEKNEFSIKKTIEHDEVDTNFLIYIPTDKPVDTENWLLDILTYSEEYYADTVALTMRRLGLTNTDLRRIVERYAKFFDNETRNKKLNSYVEVCDQMRGDELKMAMICVLVKASSRSIESVITELVFDTSSGTKYADIKKFGFDDYLWDEISSFYNYEGDQKIEVLIRKFLFTALLEQNADFGDLPSFYQQYMISGVGKMDAKFFVDKIKTDKRYPILQFDIAGELKIEGLLVSRNIACVKEADIFECIDIQIIKTIAESLKNGSLDYDTFDRVIASRINSIWYDEHKTEYELLASTIAFLRILEKPVPNQLLSTDYIREYTKIYYRVDYHYRHICTCYRCIVHPINEFDWLMERVELVYQSKFLDALGKEYSDSLTRQGEWRFAGIPMTTDFYRSVQRNNYKKCIVIISDGLRYEIAQELYDRIQVDSILKGSVEISCAISPIPSETRYGMAALLPHKSISYSNEAVFTDGQPTNGIVARDAVLKAKNSSYAAIGYEEINSMSRPELRSYMTEKSLVYIYHNVIDNAGEHNERKVFDVVPTAINEILMLVRKLYNSLQISNFYITADHGFLYRSNRVDESLKYSNVVSMHPTEASKRYVLTDDSSFSIPYTLEFPLVAEDGNYKVVTPYSYDLFKTQGSGLQYIHGGASLQETVVPIIYIGELSSAKNKDAVTPVGVRLKSITRKITNRSFALEFEQYEKVEGLKQPISCETYIVDEDGNNVSGTYPFMASSTSDDAATRVTSVRFTLMNIQFDRSKRYFLVLRDTAKPDEYIEKEQFIIDILALKVL
ncbi:MAG: BREX-1 system phosphatase PglZ type A [Syntrophomonadaceae bacterium]|nr:BREX-1 system phosphatase PglZ type A [Syntrophomonadaceae bacterium]